MEREGRAISVQVFQSLWAMEDLPSGAPEPWTLPQWVEQIAGGGFDGLAVDLGARQAPTAEELSPLLAGSGLGRAVFAFVRDEAELEVALRYAGKIEAPLLVVCAQLFDLDLRTIGARVSSWHALAARLGVTLQLETHRGTATNEIRTTVALLGELDPGIHLAVDLSHHVCGCELPDQPDPEVEALVGAILARAGSLQGRVATRGQIQVPLHHQEHQDWVARFRAWWVQGFRAIDSRTPGEAMFCAELGTRPYAPTDVDGRELADRWAEALLLQRWAREDYRSAKERSTL